jgi:hypothetical protein
MQRRPEPIGEKQGLGEQRFGVVGAAVERMALDRQSGGVGSLTMASDINGRRVDLPASCRGRSAPNTLSPRSSISKT